MAHRIFGAQSIAPRECMIATGGAMLRAPIRDECERKLESMFIGRHGIITIVIIINIIRQLLRQRIASGKQNKSHEQQHRPNHVTPNIVFDGVDTIAHLDLMVRNFEDDFQHAKERRGHTDNLNQSPYSSFHFTKARVVTPVKSVLTVGRIKTIRVNTPRTVPKGMNMHATPPITVQNV